MATQVYTWRVVYEGLEDKIWRKVQVSSNYRLDQLGYLTLAMFDTLAYHMFEFEYGEQCYQIPDDETDPDEQLDMRDYKLYQLHLSVGDRLRMVYDFGTEQVFGFELLSVEPMPKGRGMSYPHIIEGAGRGILDDVYVDELRDLVGQIDRQGHTDEPFFYNDNARPWDYREFVLDEYTDRLVRACTRRIEEAYEPFWFDFEDFEDDEDDE
ncbi:MAG: plasmid pRiA4b ORF-3 family protein [Aristaeellaceae bacterium]